MKAEITLNLRTREVYKLFERKIRGDRLFMDAVLHKINIVISRCSKQDPIALKALREIDKQLNTLKQKFTSEIKRFEELLFLILWQSDNSGTQHHLHFVGNCNKKQCNSLRIELHNTTSVLPIRNNDLYRLCYILKLYKFKEVCHPKN